jgi:hypothetical protein
MSETAWVHTLEDFIDRHGMKGVMDALARIADEKADHVRTNWQDEKTARTWERDARKADRLALKLENPRRKKSRKVRGGFSPDLAKTMRPGERSRFTRAGKMPSLDIIPRTFNMSPSKSGAVAGRVMKITYEGMSGAYYDHTFGNSVMMIAPKNRHYIILADIKNKMKWTAARGIEG